MVRLTLSFYLLYIHLRKKTLRTLCSKLSITVSVVDFLTTCDTRRPSLDDDENAETLRVSSTRVTESVLNGDMMTTRALLGRKYRLVANEWLIECT